MSNQELPLRGYRFIVIEDEMLQALELAAMLETLGGTVVMTAFGYDQARDAIEKIEFDCAILDVNLGGTLSFPVAQSLQSAGKPYLFCTAYGEAAKVHRPTANAPRIHKPVNIGDLRDALLGILKGKPRWQTRLRRVMPFS